MSTTCSCHSNFDYCRSTKFFSRITRTFFTASLNPAYVSCWRGAESEHSGIHVRLFDGKSRRRTLLSTPRLPSFSSSPLSLPHTTQHTHAQTHTDTNPRPHTQTDGTGQRKSDTHAASVCSVCAVCPDRQLATIRNVIKRLKIEIEGCPTFPFTKNVFSENFDDSPFLVT